MKKRTEQSLVRQIMAYLSYVPNLRVWRSNTGAAWHGDRIVRYGMPGSADISGIVRGGRRLEIEVKSQKGKLSKRQDEFGQMIKKMGGVYLVARSLDDVIRFVEDGGAND